MDENLPDDLSELHEPGAGTETVGFAGHATRTAWAYCKDGFVCAVKVVDSHLPHPFGKHVETKIMGVAQDPAREYVVNVTGVACHPGYILDNKGNVAPAGNRTEALAPHEPGYHDRLVTPADPVTVDAAIAQRPPVDAQPGAPNVIDADSKREAEGEGHPENIGTNGAAETEHPTGFAAVDAKAHD